MFIKLMKHFLCGRGSYYSLTQYKIVSLYDIYTRFILTRQKGHLENTYLKSVVFNG